MTKRTKLYTRYGDKGFTRLLGEDRVPKYDPRPEAYGTVDEATSFMGLVRAEPAASERTKNLLLTAQRDLWILMGELASTAEVKLSKRIEAARTEWLEAETDKLGDEIPPLTQFVLPGATKVSALLDVARTVIRRAERDVVQLSHQELLHNDEILRYLNRLSALLFAQARYEEHRAGQKSTLTKEAG
jgi:cob(I)alamin adenosyltransferase